MDVTGEGGYNPSEYAPDVMSRFPEEKDGGGIGQRSEKHPTATLRLIGTNLGHQWIAYGHVGGGSQDYRLTEGIEGRGRKVQCDWFFFYYQGILHTDGRDVFGDWKVTVRGSGLEPVANDVARQVRSLLRVGEAENSLQPVRLESITIEPYTPEPQDGTVREDD